MAVVEANEGSENSVRNNQEIDCVDQIYKYLAEDTTKIKCLQYGFCVCKLVNKKCVTYFMNFRTLTTRTE